MSEIRLGSTAASVAKWSDTSIVAIVPSGAASDTFVITANGQSAVSPSFSVTSLPAGWLDQDVGAVPKAGSATYANGTYTVQGAGNGVGTTNADGVHFVYQQLTGDGAIVVRIVSRTDTNAYVGVMFRETLDAGARSMYVGFSGGSLYLQSFYRTTPGARSDYYSVADGYALPYWLKLVRRGNSFTAFAASDGENWYQLGSSRTIDMAADVYAGLAVSRYPYSSSSSVVFDNVSLSSAADPAPVIDGVSATTASVGSSIVIGGSNFGAAQGSSVVLLNGAAVPVDSWSDTSITITIPSGASSGYLVISKAPKMNSSNPVLFTVTSQPLPTGWLDQDVGSVKTPGSVAYSGGTYTVQGAGNGVGSTNADGVHFVYQQLTGDGTIVARIVSRTDTNAYVGVMFRETLDAGAKSMYVGFSGGSLYLQAFFRTTPGARSDYYSVADGYALPYWLKLVRRGNSFTAFAASDGENWYQLGSSRTIDMAADVYAGLAVSRSSGSSSSSVVFDNVSLASAADPSPVINGISATTASVGSSIVIGGSNFGAAQGSSVVLLNGAVVPVGS